MRTCAPGHNTGYQSNDPSMPCLKCWERYSSPFTGPIVYMPWNASASHDGARNTYQRPLPRFTPPQRATSLGRARGYPGAASRMQMAGRSQFLEPLPRPLLGRPPSNVRVAQRPPPGAAVVQPGDPRIGGRVCRQCGGTGVMTFLIFEDTCPVCNGIGRTFD